jgi:hypothetical protein
MVRHSELVSESIMPFNLDIKSPLGDLGVKPQLYFAGFRNKASLQCA